LVVERGEQQRRRLAADARDGQQYAGQHTRPRGAISDAGNHDGTRRAEGDRRLPQLFRNEQQHVLGCAHDYRNDDQRQGQSAGIAGEMAERRDHDLVDEQAYYDRWRAQQDVVDEAHAGGEPVVASVFSEVGPGQNPERAAHENRERRYEQAAHDWVEQPAGGAGRRRHLGEDAER
jgi:hypothetical protein